MVYWVKDLFSEKGSISMMRVLSLTSCVTAVAIAIIGVVKPSPDYSGLSLLCGTFLTAAFTGKVMQKRIETNFSGKDPQS
jgi:hypothetical protein